MHVTYTRLLAFSHSTIRMQTLAAHADYEGTYTQAQTHTDTDTDNHQTDRQTHTHTDTHTDTHRHRHRHTDTQTHTHTHTQTHTQTQTHTHTHTHTHRVILYYARNCRQLFNNKYSKQNPASRAGGDDGLRMFHCVEKTSISIKDSRGRQDIYRSRLKTLRQSQGHPTRISHQAAVMGDGWNP